MKKLCYLVALVLLATLVHGAQEGPKNQDLVLATYPDPGATVLARALRVVAAEYKKEYPDLNIVINRSLSYGRARRGVIEGRVDGLLISERMNKIRLQKAARRGGRAGRGYRKVELGQFTPMVHRVIRSREEVLDTFVLGVAHGGMSDELKGFVAFLSSQEGRKALAGMPYIEPAEK